MNLELKITEEDIKAVLIGQRESIMRVSKIISRGKPEYRPTFVSESAVTANTILEANKGLQTVFGEVKYNGLVSLLTPLPALARAVHEAAVEGHLAEAESFGDILIHAYFTLLNGVAKACNKLLRISTAGLEGEAAEQLVFVRKYVAKVVVEANALYGKATAAEFLRLTNSGRAEYVEAKLESILKP